nr:aminoglycoside phosphotransferase family protein [Anaerolineae bacterium]
MREGANHYPSKARRRPASDAALKGLLYELDIKPPGEPSFELISTWAAKHVCRVNVAGQPWAYIRYLLGDAAQYPQRWQHLELGTIFHEARIGPQILGITPSSSTLDGRAAIVETALLPITRDELEARAEEAISLITRLHTNMPLSTALVAQVTEGDRERFQPIDRLFSEIRERWFEAVVDRWLAAGLLEITRLAELVSEVINQLEPLLCCQSEEGIIVPTHNDLNHGNFMVNKAGALRLIDFENLALNNPVADLGIFLTWYVDQDRHLEMLSHYPLGTPEDILERMRIWVPLQYLAIAAHWAARLTQAKDEDAW